MKIVSWLTDVQHGLPIWDRMPPAEGSDVRDVHNPASTLGFQTCTVARGITVGKTLLTLILIARLGSTYSLRTLRCYTWQLPGKNKFC